MALRGTALSSAVLQERWPTAEKMITGHVPWVQQRYTETTLTAVKRWLEGPSCFPPVCVCMAQCKASREMLRVGIASGHTVSQLCWDRLHFCSALTSRPSASCQGAFRDEEGKELLRELFRIPASTGPAFRAALFNCVSGWSGSGTAAGKGHVGVMWIRPHTQEYAFTHMYIHTYNIVPVRK